MSTPGTGSLSWLDLACGRGQIIAFLEENLSAEARAKIEYWAYDIDQNFARETTKIAERLGFASMKSSVGHLSDLDRLLPDGALFDFITLTNTVHEIEPGSLAALLVTSVLRLEDTGTLFIYDMERISPPELGAVPWSRDDVRQMVRCMLDALGADGYRPEAGLWRHRTCNGWNVQLQRQYLSVPRVDADVRAAVAVRETRAEILRLLDRRLAGCRAALESLTAHGAETAEEQDDRERLLFEFWALSRALERGA